MPLRRKNRISSSPKLPGRHFALSHETRGGKALASRDVNSESGDRHKSGAECGKFPSRTSRSPILFWII